MSDQDRQPTPQQKQQLLEQMTLANVQEVHRGMVALQFNQLLRMAAQDIIDRPGDKSARTVKLVIQLKPVLDKKTGVLDVITNEFEFDHKFPKFRSEPYPMLVDADGVMYFQPGSPFDPRQLSFGFGVDGEKVDKATGEVIDDQPDAPDTPNAPHEQL